MLNSLSDLNILRILRLIWQERKISRVDIASILKMDKSTVTKIVLDLTASNIVFETDLGESGPQGGRKPIYLEINGNIACVGGIEINSEHLYVVLVDLNGKTLFKNVEPIIPLTYKESGFEYYFKLGIEQIEKEATKRKIKLVGIGLGVPGLTDVRNGRIMQSIPLMISSPKDIVQEAASYTKIPVFLENDARCCCHAMQIYKGSIRNTKNMMFILAQHRLTKPIDDAQKNLSIGLGLILNGQIYHGANCAAGEFRSMEWNGASTTQFLSGNGLLESLDDVNVVTPIYKELARNIAFLVNTLTLDVVYVGGVEKKYSEEIVRHIREEIVYLWPYEWNKTSMVTTAEISVAFGAATMVLDKVFALPELNKSKQEDTSKINKRLLRFK